MKNKILVSALIAISSLGFSSLGAQTITGFGTGQYTISFGPGNVQNANGFSISGIDDDILVNGTVATLALPDFATRSLSLTATLTAANTSAFSIELVDSTFVSAVYVGSWSNFTVNTPNTVTLTYDGGASGAFNGSISRILVVSASGSGDPISFTMDELSVVPVVVPEPSTYAALAGISVLGLVAFRRRRVVA